MSQLTHDDLAGMSPQAIVEAKAAGRLDALLGVPAADVELLDRARNGGTLTRPDLARLNRLGRPDLVVSAHEEDRITDTTQED